MRDHTFARKTMAAAQPGVFFTRQKRDRKRADDRAYITTRPSRQRTSGQYFTLLLPGCQTSADNIAQHVGRFLENDIWKLIIVVSGAKAKRLA